MKRFILGVSDRFCFVYIKNVLFFEHYGVTEKTLFMSALIISNVLILGGTALAAAIVLYVVSQKFRVEENPKISEIEALLPGANCGACGKAGCHAFAVACANSSADQFKELLAGVPLEHAKISSDIISYAKGALKLKLNQSI